MDNCKIISLNTRGLRAEKKRRELYTYLCNKNCDIMCLQETHSTMDDENLWQLQWGGKILYAHGTSQSKGVCILISRKVEQNVKILESNCDPNGRYIIAVLQIGERIVVLANVYAPNQDDPNFFQQLIQNIARTNQAEIILLGDFNLVLSPELDRSEKVQYHPRSHKVLLNYIESDDLIDLWRCKHPDKRIYSWYKKCSNTACGSRIDFALMSAGVANCVTDIDYKYGYQTDHSMLEINLCNQKQTRGPGYWKFNTRLLYDQEFVNRINDLIKKVEESCTARTVSEIWEICKEQMMNAAKKRSKQIASERNLKFKQLLTTIEALNSERMT